MNDTWMSFSVILVVVFSAWGWGNMILRPTGADRRMAVAYPITVGLAGWCFIGGLLNLAHFAMRPALIALLIIGVGLSAFECLARIRAFKSGGSETVTVDLLLPAAGLIFLLALLTSLQLPPAIVNTGDDFEAYFPRPVRMLATGTLGGDVFDGMGLDSFGGHFFSWGCFWRFFRCRA